MARFRFRLQALLDQKREAKERTQEALARKQSVLSAEQSELCAREAQRDRIAARIGVLRGSVGQALGLRRPLRPPHTTQQPLPAAQVQNQREYLRGLRQDLEAAGDAIFAQRLAYEAVEDHVRAARDELAERSREVEVLEKYRDKQERRFISEQMRNEENELDEIGAVLQQSRAAERRI
jgi:flagellar biosynthesis chaperone FliJ